MPGEWKILIARRRDLNLTKSMESRKSQLGKMSKTMVGTSSSSHVMSKFNAASCGITPAIIQHRSSKSTPTIRIVHIFPPKIIKTDPANFRAIVQKLTGKHSRRSSKKPKQKLQNPRVNPHSGAQVEYPVHLSEQPEQEKCPCYQQQIVDPLAETRREFSKEDGVKPWENFAPYFGGFGSEIDIFATLMDSRSMLPEIPIANRSIAEHMDYHTGVFWASQSSGFTHFSQPSLFQ